MTAFKSLEQIRQELKVSGLDPDEIRRELLVRLKEVHPDTRRYSAESPRSPGDEAVRITAALEFLDEVRRRTAVVPVEEVTSLVRAVRDLMPANEEKRLHDRFEQLIAAQTKQATRAGRTPLRFLAACAALIILLWLFPALTRDHPVLGHAVQVEDPVFNLLWAVALCYTAAAVLVVKLWNQRGLEAVRKLKLEATHNSLFEAFLLSLEQPGAAAGGIGFYKDQFVDYIASRGLARSAVSSLLLGRPRSVDAELAQTLVEIILRRAERRGVLKKEDRASLRDYYVLVVAFRDL